MPDTASPVAVIGLGAMGSRIAARLLESGYELVIWNRNPEKAEPLAARGGSIAASPAEATRRAGAVITMVSDSEALRDITEGTEGLTAGATDATTVVQMSTVGPAAIQRLASTLSGRAALLDAPVLGSLDEAASGTLTIFVGGPESLVERWRPLLSTLGSVVHVGAIGGGSSAKLVANSSLFGMLGVLGEALALAEALGLSRQSTFDVLAATPLAAQAERRRPSVESGEYPARFPLSLARKDSDLILDAAEACGAELRLAAAARTWLAEADRGRGDEDYGAVLARIIRR